MENSHPAPRLCYSVQLQGAAYLDRAEIVTSQSSLYHYWLGDHGFWKCNVCYNKKKKIHLEEKRKEFVF